MDNELFLGKLETKMDMLLIDLKEVKEDITHIRNNDKDKLQRLSVNEINITNIYKRIDKLENNIKELENKMIKPTALENLFFSSIPAILVFILIEVIKFI